MTDNQFIDWYVDTLTIKEVIAALKAVEIKVNKKKNAYDMLKSAWKKGPNSLQVAISAYFDEQHKEAREEINSKSRDECRNELNDLVTRFGVKSMVFVLIINSDRFKKEIGYQLVNERGDEVEPVEDDGDDLFLLSRSRMPLYQEKQTAKARKEPVAANHLPSPASANKQ